MVGLDPVANALLNPPAAFPLMDLVGPTADDDIRRAIDRYGAEAVKQAVNRQTKAKIGRPKVNDWKELHSVIEEDARTWLEGGDPFAARSNYSIAKAFADENPGQSHPATMKRIQRKLGSPRHGRQWFTLVSAWMQSEDSYPYTAHIRTLRELCELDSAEMWGWNLARAEGSIADYTAKHGSPADRLTMKEIEQRAKEPLNALLGIDRFQPRRGGLFGLLPSPGTFENSRSEQAPPLSENALAGLLARYATNPGPDE